MPFQTHLLAREHSKTRWRTSLKPAHKSLWFLKSRRQDVSTSIHRSNSLFKKRLLLWNRYTISPNAKLAFLIDAPLCSREIDYIFLFFAYFVQIVNKKRPHQEPENTLPGDPMNWFKKTKFKFIPIFFGFNAAAEFGPETLIFYVQYYYYHYEVYNKKQKKSSGKKRMLCTCA